MKKSRILTEMNETARGLNRIGVLDQQTMRDFDESCLEVISKISPDNIKRLRLRYRKSQSVFARYLNTSESTVEKWETGKKQPSGAALKLLTIIQKHGLEILS